MSSTANRTTNETRREGMTPTVQLPSDRSADSPPYELLRLQQAVGNRVVHALSQDADGTPPVARLAIARNGVPLDATLQSEMETRFDADFGNVVVHADADAAETATAMNANAFTLGSHIVFGRDLYAPRSAEGRQLIAHELAHVMQQRRGRGGGGLGAEFEAQRAGTRAAAGHPATVQSSGAAVQCDGAGSLSAGLPRILVEQVTSEGVKRWPDAALKSEIDVCRQWLATHGNEQTSSRDVVQAGRQILEAELLRRTRMQEQVDSRNEANESAVERAKKEQWKREYPKSQRTPPAWLSAMGPGYVSAYYVDPSRNLHHPLLKQQSETATKAAVGHATLGTELVGAAFAVTAAATLVIEAGITLPVVATIALEAAAGTQVLTPLVSLVIANPLAVTDLALFGGGVVLSMAAAGGIKEWLHSISTAEGALHLAFDVFVLHGQVRSSTGGPPLPVTFKGRVEKATAPGGFNFRITEGASTAGGAGQSGLSGQRSGSPSVPPKAASKLARTGIVGRAAGGPGRAGNDNAIPPNEASSGQLAETGTGGGIRTGTAVAPSVAVSQRGAGRAAVASAGKPGPKPVPKAPTPGNWTRQGFGTAAPTTRANTPPLPKNRMRPDIEFGKRKPSAEEALAGPQTQTEEAEALGATAGSNEKNTSRKKGPKPYTSRTAQARAGVELEPVLVEEFAARNPGFKVHPNETFEQSLPWLRRLYPRWNKAVTSGPDAVAVSASKKLLVIFDSAGSPTPGHVAKSQGYTSHIDANLPAEYAGYTVIWAEDYWQFGEKGRSGQ